MPKFKVVVTDDRFKTYAEEEAVLNPIGVELVVTNCATPDAVLLACRDADGVLCNLAPMPAAVIQGLEKCRIIARYGVGYDNVDVAACTARGIRVANVPDYCAEDVSDHALALLMGCIRKIARRDAQVRAGHWNVGRADPMHRPAGRTFVFLGFGRIGRCLLRKLRGLNFGRILVFDPFLDEATIEAAGAEKVHWSVALREADYLSIHMPLNADTRGCLNRAAFAQMKRGVILVNTSRGPIIDEPALIEALQSGQVNSAGLDVHVKEPLDKDSPLMKLENCILTDHVGWYSEESMAELKRKAAENVRAVLLGGAPAYPVNQV